MLYSDFNADKHLSREVFASLRAEREVDWLGDIFFAQPDFAAMCEDRSFVIFGESGAGKSALRLELARQAMASPERPLIASWQPYLPAPERPPAQTLQIFSRQIFEASALALLEHLGRHPHRFAAAPPWVQAMATWFLQRYLQPEWDLRLDRMTENYPQDGVSLLPTLFAEAAEPYLRADASVTQIIAELALTANRLGLSGIWVMVDGLEPWLEVDEETISHLLATLFGTLAVFEDPGFTLLRYLYTHPDQRCQRQELYFRGYLGADSVPSQDILERVSEQEDDKGKAPKDWKHALDTYLHRLRQNLQPEAESPRYLVSEKGGWVQLINTL